MIRITLFRRNNGGSEEAGEIEFRTLLVTKEEDYASQPGGLLSLEEAKEVCEVLRHLPQIHMGQIGSYVWREV